MKAKAKKAEAVLSVVEANIAASDPWVDTWIPSRYNFHATLEGGSHVVSNLFTGETETIDAAAWETYLAPGTQYQVPAAAVPTVAQNLFDWGFLVSQSIDEIERIRVSFQEVRYSTVGLRVLIAPTLACNLRCSYCFERGVRGSAAMRRMSLGTADAVSAFVEQACDGKQDVVVNWFGGEPLTRMDIIGRISERLLRTLKGSNVRYLGGLTTNGVMLTPEVVRRLCAWKVQECQLTVDVPSTNKLDARGRPVLNRQLDRAAEAAEHLRIKLRINVGQDSEAAFDALYAALVTRGLHKTLDRVHMTRVLSTECDGEACASSLLEKRASAAMFRRERAKMRALGLPLRAPVPTSSEPCGATCVDQILIDPRGFLYKCMSDLGMPERAYASVVDHRPVRPRNLLPWLTYDWFSHEECRTCPVLPRCAGGCPHRRMRRYVSDFCRFNAEEWADWPDLLRDYVAAGRA
jgi:uncharacterized protein